MLLLFKATTKKTNMLKKMYIQLDENEKNRNWFNDQLSDDMKVNLFFVLKSARYYQVESTELGFSAIEMTPFEKHRYCLGSVKFSSIDSIL